MNFHETAVDAGKRMAAILIEEGHDDLGVMLSLDHFQNGMREAFSEFKADDPERLANLALATARAELKRRKAH